MSKRYAIMFIVREVTVDDEPVETDESMYVKLHQVVPACELRDTFDRYRDAVCATFGAEGEQVIELTDKGFNKIALIKTIRDVAGLGLIEAKNRAEAPMGTALVRLLPGNEKEIVDAFFQAGVKVRVRGLRQSDGDVPLERRR